MDESSDNVYDFADLLLHEPSTHPVPSNTALRIIPKEEIKTEDDAESVAPATHHEDWVNPLTSLQAYSVEPQEVLNDILHHGVDPEELDDQYSDRESDSDESGADEIPEENDKKEEDDINQQNLAPPVKNFKIVSLDPTSFPDAKVKKLKPVADVAQGRHSKNKQKARPQRLMELAPPSATKLPKKRTRPQVDYSYDEDTSSAVTKQKKKVKVNANVLTKPGKKKRGRPPKNEQPNQKVTVKVEPEDCEIGNEDEYEEEMYDPVDYSPEKAKRRRMNSKSLKGTHIMRYKEYRCFVCNDGEVYATQNAFIQHWQRMHFILKLNVATLFCGYCPAKYQVTLNRFHRPTEVLQYVAFFFNHMIRKHDLEPPDYVETLKCSEPNCHYIAYTTYSLSRHEEEGKHRMKPLSAHRLPPEDGSGRREQLGEIKNLPGNKYSLIFKCYKCFICQDDKVYRDGAHFLDHWRKNHFTFSDSEATIMCGSCDAKYRVPRDRFHRHTDTMQYIAYYFSHLVKRHQFEVPDYIAQLSCGQSGCKFTTYTKQLLERHLQEVKHITLTRTPALNTGTSSQTSSQSTRSPYLSFTEFRCFCCTDNEGEHLGPFDNGATLAEHWRTNHYTRENKRHVLRCDSCSLVYTIQDVRYSRNGDVLAMIARFFTHKVKKHNFPIPSYIEELCCPVPGCDYRCFTAQILDGHRTSKRDPAHMGVESGEATSNLSIRYNKIHPSAGRMRPTKTSTQQSVEAGNSTESQNTEPQDQMSCLAGTSEIELSTLSKELAKEVMRDIVESQDGASQEYAPDDCEDGNVDEHPNEFSGIDVKDSKAKSLLIFKEIKCFVCNDGEIFENHNKFVNHWRSNHFTIGDYEVFITCPQCQARIGLNRPLWHRDHDIGRCVASFLTHLIKQHGQVVPSYIKELVCPETGCGYRTLTLKHFQFHMRHTKHHKLERAKRIASGEEAGTMISDHLRKGYPFRLTDNGLSFKEFQCYLCQDGVVYQTTMDYENHWREKHCKEVKGKKDVVYCHICETTFASQLYPSIAFLFCHLVKKHDFTVPWYIEELRCEVPQCNYQTFTKALFEKHKAGQRHISGSGLFQYYLNFLEYRCFLCASPSELYSTKRLFEQHLMEAHVENSGDGGEYICCPQCNHHFVLHFCKKPDMKYEKADPSRTLCVLFNHMVVKHNQKIPPYIKAFACSHDGCNFVTVRKYTLSRHELSHVSDQQCYQCGMFFSVTRIDKHVHKCTSSDLTVGKGSTNTSFTCPECGVSMMQKKALSRHLVEVHNVTTQQSMDIVAHIAPKTKSSKTKASESGVAYKCSECGKILLEKKSMKRHMLSTHMVNVEYADLNAIEYNHNSVEIPKNYQCLLCGVRMNLMKSVKRHLMKQHKLKVGMVESDISVYVRIDELHEPDPDLSQNSTERFEDLLHQDAAVAINNTVEHGFKMNTEQFTANPGTSQHQNQMNTTIMSIPRTEQLSSMIPSSQHHNIYGQQPKPTNTIISNNQALDFSMRYSDIGSGEASRSVPEHNQMEMMPMRMIQSHAEPNNPHLHNPVPMRHDSNVGPIQSSTELINQRLAMMQQTTLDPSHLSGQDMAMQMMPMDYRVAQSSVSQLLQQRLTTWPHHSQQQ